ncbi:hypothetical protein Q7P36_000183 [Cladosporium allicinum]
MAGRYDFRNSTVAQHTNPVIQQPVVQQPIIQQPIVQQPIVQQPIIQPQRPRLNLRRLSDSTNTDTESDFTEDKVTDNGEEHPTNREARRLLIWQAKVRWNNRIDQLQNAIDAVNNGFPGANRGLNYLYNDIAWPFYQEMEVQLHAAYILSVRAIFHLGRLTWDFFAEVFDILDLLRQFIIRNGRELLIRSGQWIWARLGALYDCLVILAGWLLQVGLASAVVFGRFLRTCMVYLRIFAVSIYNGLGMFLHWLTHDGMKLAILLGLASMLSMSVLKGWEGMCLFVCDDIVYNNTELLVNGSLLQTSCELDDVNNTIKLVHSELAALLDASDAVILTTDEMAHPAFIAVNRPLEDLIQTISRLNTYVGLHQLSDLTINPEDTGAVATIPPQNIPTVYEELTNHARAIKNHSEIVRHIFTIQYDELNIRLNAIQEFSKDNETQSAVGLFFSETFAYILPSAFKFTHAHRQASHYARVAQVILEGNSTLPLLEMSSDIAWWIGRMSELMVPVREQLHNFQDKWIVACETWKAIWGEGATMEDVVKSAGHEFKGYGLVWQLVDDAKRCEKSPDTYVKDLDAAIATVKSAAGRIVQADADHKIILQGLVDLHKQVHDLIHKAVGWKNDPRTKRLLPDLLEPRSCDGFPRCLGDGTRSPLKISPQCSRTILREFVTRVGNMDIKLGRQRSTPKDQVFQGKYKDFRDENGEVVGEHVSDPNFRADNSPGWAARSRDWVGGVLKAVDEWM